MAKAELGQKRKCTECETLFYDLNRVPPVCPKCGAAQPENASRLKRRDEEHFSRKEKDFAVVEDEHDLDNPEEEDTDAEDLDDDIGKDVPVSTDEDEHDDD